MFFSNAARAFLRTTCKLRLNGNDTITVLGVGCVTIANLADAYSIVKVPSIEESDKHSPAICPKK
jgi:hypothetical protein